MPSTADTVRVTFAPPHIPSDEELCRRFGVPLATTVDDTAWQLRRTHDGSLELQGPGGRGEAGLRIGINPCHGELAHRLHTSRRKDPLARAIGLHRRNAPVRVVDATAGLGRDAMVLASLGCCVTAIERVPALALLLHAATASRFVFAVICADASEWLRTQPTGARPDVVYLDPMFAEPGRAQVKKEMQVCRALATADGANEVFAAAMACAKDRVVVKRHPDGAPLAAGPSFTVGSNRIRFDVYLRGPANTGH
ncbi:MAG: class I SAM-dependent methyltransferase [Planctomycetes bacterium]|nr:class I SAM-dependent methyltransferase [Planctomycetota bacterium]